MQNPGFELGTWTRSTHTGQEFGEIFVPTGWVAFWKEGGPVPYDPKNLVGYGRPEMKVIRKEPPFLDPPRIHEGQWACMWFTFYRIHDAGLYQNFAVQPGTRLRFSAWAHAWSAQGDDARHSDLSGDAANNFTFMVGIDPTGGTDPWSSTVVWGNGAHIYDAYAPIPVVEVVARAGRVTAFVRSTVLYPFKHCDAYVDSATLEVVEPLPTDDRLPYPVTVILLPQDATLDEKRCVVELADADKRTFMQSAGDAAFLAAHGADGSVVQVFGRARWPDDIDAYLRAHGVENIEYYDFPGDTPAPPSPPPPPPPLGGLYIPYGTKLCIHAIAPGGTPEHAAYRAQAGAPVAVFKAVDDWGYLRLVKEWSPATLTIARHTMAFDGAGEVQNWTQAQIEQTAYDYMGAYYALLTDQSQYDDGQRLQYVDWLELLNEADPPGPRGYANLARLMMAMLGIGEAWNLPIKKFACFGMNAGTPEWDEMLAIVDTGLLERIVHGGHILTLHEGTLPFSDPIDKYWPGQIPGAPALNPPAGAMCGRYRYWLHLARQRGLYLPIVISEFVSGPDYDPAHADQVLERLAWYEILVTQDPEVLGFCPFTNGGVYGWSEQNYDPFLPAFYDYAVAIKSRRNAEPGD